MTRRRSSQNFELYEGESVHKNRNERKIRKEFKSYSVFLKYTFIWLNIFVTVTRRCFASPSVEVFQPGVSQKAIIHIVNTFDILDCVVFCKNCGSQHFGYMRFVLLGRARLPELPIPQTRINFISYFRSKTFSFSNEAVRIRFKMCISVWRGRRGGSLDGEKWRED